ncbi:MAG: YeiH family putative sulfate export transporter [bacterium]|nr:YeiH family putative sulfate export transporter [bacterium]
MTKSESIRKISLLNGILFVALFALAATYISEFPFFKDLNFSPLIIGIVIGIFYANTLRSNLPRAWAPGIEFSCKTLLREGIILYGFRITFQSIMDIGIQGIIISILMVTITFFIGYIVGTKLLKMDRDTVILTSAGSSICGAAAILATEPILKAKPYKSAIAVSTVVVFGTIAMFLYPLLFKSGLIPLGLKGMGIYIGGSIHEVAQVVAAGTAIAEKTAESAVIVKMIRVMLLAPFLIILSIWLSKQCVGKLRGERSKIKIPWFAVVFILVAVFNSFNFLPTQAVSFINNIDTFILTMAMTALGMETKTKNFKDVGIKPVYLGLILFAWLIFGGLTITKIVTSIFA